MRLVDICIRRPVSTTMLIAFLVVLGLISYQRMSVDLFPNVDFPIVSVTATLPGASVEEIESSVTKPLEEAINTIEGIDEMRSETHEGVSRVMLFFVLERDGQAAAQDVRDRVAATLSRLPVGTDPPVVEKFDVEAAPILSLVVSGDRDLREVTEIARKEIKEDIETLRGVGSVTLIGGRERAINLILDADRLFAYGLSIDQVKAAIAAQNLEIPGGHVAQGAKELTLRTMGRIDRVEDFTRLIVANVGGRPLTIGDLGRVEDGVVEPRNLARLDGKPAVTLLLRKQSGTNTVDMLKKVKRRLAEITPNLPRDIGVQVIRDHSRFIESSIEEVRFHLILAGVLVSLTVMLFISNLRATIIAAIAIPTSIVASFTVMRWFDFTLNNITMLALVLSTGIVIDDAVVVLENIFRHMEERGSSAMRAASEATREISLAVMATTFSLVVIFLPVAFMEGQVGRFFNSFGVTVAVSILVSLLVSFTLTPMLCSRFLRLAPAAETTRERGVYAAIDRAYGAILRWSLAHRWAVVIVSFLTVAATVPLFTMVGKDFMPNDDQGEFEVLVYTPEGYSLSRTDATLQAIEARLRELPNVRHVLTEIGDVSGRLRAGEGPVTRAGVYVRLDDLDKREISQFEIMRQARAAMADFPDMRISVQNVSVFGSGGHRFSDVEFDLTGPSIAKLDQYSRGIVEALRTTPNFVDVDTTLSVRQPELRVQISREKASNFGIQVGAVAAALRTMVGGEVVGKYREEQEQYDVWLRADLTNRNDPRAIADLPISTPGGQLIPLSNLANLVEERGPAQIDHFNRRRKVTMVANLDGVPLNVGIERARKVIDSLDLAPGYAADFTGNAQSLEETGVNFLIAFGLSFVFMYMILAAQFESYVDPITILLALPLSIPFALASLVLTGETLNVYSVFGIFMLFGIVKKNGILQVDYANQLRAEGMPRDEAILQSNHVRLRPILMTTVMLIAGMVPIALGQGPGAASRASMAKVIIGGQALCLLLTLLVTPVAYSLFDDFAQRLGSVRALVRWRREPRPAASEAAADVRAGG